MATCVAGVITIEEWVANNCDWSQRFYQMNQTNLYIQSALKVAKKVLERDDNDYDAENETWATLPPIPLKGGEVNIKIVPTNARLNLNLLLSHNKKVKNRVKKAIRQIFIHNGADEMSLDCLLAWIEKDKNYDETYYLTHIPVYRPRKQPFYSLKEVDYVEGLAGFSDKFYPFFSVDTESEKININFAGEEVIRAYLPEIAQCASEIVEYRKKRPFKNITQLRNVAGITDNDYLAVQPFITTKSDRFAVRIEVNLSNYQYYATALIKRKERRTQIIKYFEGKGFYE